MGKPLSTFEIRFAPRESDDPDAIERIAAADLSLFANGVCLTELEDRAAHTVRSTLRASAYRLAYWLAQNWWRLRWEPEADDIDWRMSHILSAVGGGYVWPALRIISDGEGTTLRMRSHRPQNAKVAIEGIRYLVDDEVRIPVDAFIAGVDAFIDAVIERLRGTGHADTELESLWAEVQSERRSADLAAWRKLEALAGLDPDAGDGEFLEAMRLEQAQTGPAAIDELVAACKRDAPETLNSLQNACRRMATTLANDAIAPLRERVQSETAQRITRSLRDGTIQAPWQRAYRLADMARAHWNLVPGKVTNRVLHELLGLPESILASPSEPTVSQISAGYREDESSRLSIWLGVRTPTGRRFALARLLGDHLFSGDEERLLPATPARTARQKYQRAFAQQFLCPIEDLKGFLGADHPSDEQIEEAATAFDVSPLLIKTTLVNHGLIERQALSTI